MKKLMCMVLSVMVIMTGCTSIVTEVADTLRDVVDSSDSSESDTQDTTQEVHTAEWTDKFNAYVDFHNQVTSPLGDYLGSYIMYFGSDEEYQLPSNVERLSPISETAAHFTYPKAAITMSQSDPSFGEIDEYARLSAEKYLELVNIFNDIAEYYSGPYLEDDFAQSQSLHDMFWNTYSDMFDQFNEFSYLLEVIAEENEEQEIESLFEDGYLILGSANAILLNTKNILILAQEVEYGEKEWTEIDIDSFNELQDSFSTHVDNLRLHLEDEEQISYESATLAKNSLQTMLEVAEKQIAYIDNMRELIENGSDAVEGSPTSGLTRGYDEMITWYNKSIDFISMYSF